MPEHVMTHKCHGCGTEIVGDAAHERFGTVMPCPGPPGSTGGPEPFCTYVRLPTATVAPARQVVPGRVDHPGRNDRRG